MLLRETLKQFQVCVFGSGTFGTALGSVIARNGFTVTILCRRDEVASSASLASISQKGIST